MTSCPFCGEPGRSKEHVWPKWLRKYPAYEALEAGKGGERFLRTEAPRTDPNSGHIAVGLPNVTAAVCAACNNGWMSRLETSVGQLLDPVMRTDDLGGPNLDQGARELLATWFSKCVYAYDAAVFSAPNRAWSADDYRELAATARPSAAATIWIGKSVGLLADIALSVTPLGLISIEAGASHETEWPRIVGAWMSANSVVMFGLWMPPDMHEAGMAPRLTSDDVGSMAQIWPPVVRAAWPRQYVTDEQISSLINLVAAVRDAHGIPIDEMTGDEIEDAKADMRARAAADGFAPPYAFIRRVRATR